MSVVIVTEGGKVGREKVLISLEDHNKAIVQAYDREKYSNRNGIACPNCKSELCDGDGGILLSYPPKKEILCVECGWSGLRYC